MIISVDRWMLADAVSTWFAPFSISSPPSPPSPPPPPPPSSPPSAPASTRNNWINKRWTTRKQYCLPKSQVHLSKQFILDLSNHKWSCATFSRTTLVCTVNQACLLHPLSEIDTGFCQRSDWYGNEIFQTTCTIKEVSVFHLLRCLMQDGFLLKNWRCSLWFLWSCLRYRALHFTVFQTLTPMIRVLRVLVGVNPYGPFSPALGPVIRHQRFHSVHIQWLSSDSLHLQSPNCGSLPFLVSGRVNRAAWPWREHVRWRFRISWPAAPRRSAEPRWWTPITYGPAPPVLKGGQWLACPHPRCNSPTGFLIHQPLGHWGHPGHPCCLPPPAMIPWSHSHWFPLPPPLPPPSFSLKMDRTWPGRRGRRRKKWRSLRGWTKRWIQRVIAVFNWRWPVARHAFGTGVFDTETETPPPGNTRLLFRETRTAADWTWMANGSSWRGREGGGWPQMAVMSRKGPFREARRDWWNLSLLSLRDFKCIVIRFSIEHYGQYL